MTGDPHRLLNDPATAAVLRRDLSVASGQGVAFDVGAGLARFESAVAVDLARGTGLGAGSTSGGLAVGALLLAGGLAAMLGWQLAGPAEPTGALASDPIVARRVVLEPDPTEPVVAPTPVRVPAAAPLAPVVIVDEAVVDPSPAGAKFPRGRRIHGARNEASAVATVPADHLREARELNAARGLLGSDPAQALALADAGKASFSAGDFSQEWEGVAVLALFELGRVDEARPRSAAFLEQYPNGTYAPRIRAAIAAVP
ncbi:hypothetical protein [Nannocystis sp.]|uniref:hypothetical protein n=1 Tax=Nannocystis sp. TaxID=1962667 RepID=UPI0024265A78|nr:hypothetical protein [Nannocystis sp.]MBK7824061.1 hypothetical protein [Nannocystis sp.]MBK9755075.1 hypothetical protein [Nannocystis sp.]